MYRLPVNSLDEDTVQAGFRKIDSVMEGGRTADEENDSSLTDYARTLGVKLRFTEYVRFCEKSF